MSKLEGRGEGGENSEEERGGGVEGGREGERGGGVEGGSEGERNI